MVFAFRLLSLLAVPTLLVFADTTSPAADGLLFHVSAKNGLAADTAAPGTHEPTFASRVNRIDGGATSAPDGAIECEDLQRLAWKAPGNIYAQRGTLSFFWRSRYPVGPTEFPIFRVGYGDHSSWDMVWLRIDYNGRGFDAFVTDASLARIRISTTHDPFPAPDVWTHFAFSWDEAAGIKFYLNGELVAEQTARARLDAALDQFGPHSRIISPYQVQSDYNFTRGGDIDEIRIYDHALGASAIAALARGSTPPAASPRAVTEAQREAFNFRHGFADEIPELPGSASCVRKLQFLETYDLKRWWWKANDGIRETTWPGVFNRSRLPGRNDYFKLPDWDCYSLSGQTVQFHLPAEEWNHLEFAGAAHGSAEYSKTADTNSSPGTAGLLFTRPPGRERTVHRLTQSLVGGMVRFTNREQETPIGELSAYQVDTTPAPPEARRIRLGFSGSSTSASPATARSALDFIVGRHPQPERSWLVAHRTSSSLSSPSVASKSPDTPSSGEVPLPLIHLIIPWELLTEELGDQVDQWALDGIAVNLAASATAASAKRTKWNVQVKDPLWPMRNDLDFTFSADRSSTTHLWLDLRNRVLIPGKAIYLTLASDGTEPPSADSLELILMPRSAAVGEHEIDRFNQLRDSYAMLVEEHPRGEKFNLWNRFKGDLDDLLRVSPQHQRGLEYLAASTGVISPHLQTALTAPTTSNVPLWAHRQVELLRAFERFILFYIDRRQIENGEVGGGLSDDTDLFNFWPSAALMGIQPQKVGDSVHRLLEACYTQGMFAEGLSAIQTDELHSYEEGINTLGQALLLEYGSPRQLERAMATARATERITGINTAGHRHIRSSYFSGTRIATEAPWNRSKAYSYLILHPTQMLADYNGLPRVNKFLLEMAEGLIAHRVRNERGGYTLQTAVTFETDEATASVRGYLPTSLLWTVWKQYRQDRFLQPIFDAGPAGLLELNVNALDQLSLRETARERILAGAQKVLNEEGTGGTRAGSNSQDHALLHLAWQVTGSTLYLEKLYSLQLLDALRLEYINTEGSLWTDRVGLSVAEIQRARLGGVALVRNRTAPGHVVSWNFHAPARGDSVALLVKDPTPSEFSIIAYNLEAFPVTATMTGGEIEPGIWRIQQGPDRDGNDTSDEITSSHEILFQRGEGVTVTLPPGGASVLKLELRQKGTPYSERPDIGIDREDVVKTAHGLEVRLHSLGSAPVPPFSVRVIDRSGKKVASTEVEGLNAPLDLIPVTTTITIGLDSTVDWDGCQVVVDPGKTLDEITRRNNSVTL